MANLTIEQKADLLEKFNQYIDECDFPLIPEFSYRNNITSDNVYKWAKVNTGQTDDEKMVYRAWSASYKKAMDKAEAFLNQLAIQRGQNAAPIFLLKAKHGYRDADKPEATQIHVNLPDVKSVSKDKLEQTIGTLFAPAKTAKSKTSN